MNETIFELRAIGRVESSLSDLASAPRQADEAPTGPRWSSSRRCSKASGASEPATRSFFTWLDCARRDVGGGRLIASVKDPDGNIIGLIQSD